MSSLFIYDQNIRTQNGIQTLCGLDEAGRGPLFGPVVAAAVILPSDIEFEGLNDSKKLTPKKRDRLFDQIIENAVDYAIGRAEAKEIDDINILNASLLAMRRAVNQLKTRPDLCLIDGNQLRYFESYSAKTVIKGDATSACIAAASILAKVTRDREMESYAKQYPGYGFEKNKGYPTRDHYEALDKYGPTDMHRKTFLIKWEKKRNEEK